MKREKKELREFNCQHCGQKAWAKLDNKKSCSKRCSDAVRNRKRREDARRVWKVARLCEECGAQYMPKNRNQKYCGEECGYQVDKRRQIEVSRSLRQKRCCPVCTSFFEPKNGGHKYCTPVCRVRAEMLQRKVRKEARQQQALAVRDEADWVPVKRRRTFPKRNCVICGDRFRPEKPLQTTCSTACRKANNLQHNAKNSQNQMEARALVRESMEILAERLEKRKEIKAEISGETSYSKEVEAFLARGGKVKVYPVVWSPDAFNSMPEEIF